jgi:predicted component of type VI protein secretion system
MMSFSAARLEVVAGKAAGMSILVDNELTIGRHAQGAGRLADDEEISRSHARVTLDQDGHCAVEDLGSTNGTFVNGLRISAPHALSVGDTIEVGGTTIVLREVPLSAPAPEPAPPHLQPTVVPGAARPAQQAAERGPASPAFAPGPPTPAQKPAPAAAEAAPQTKVETPAPVADEPAAPSEAPVAAAREPDGLARTAAPVPPAQERTAPADDPAVASTEASPAPLAGPPAEIKPAPPPPPLSLHLKLDVGAGEVEITFDDSTEPLRLVLEEGSWRPVRSTPTTPGG